MAMAAPVAAPGAAPIPYYIANPDDEQQQYSPAVRALAGTGAPPQQSATPPAPQGAVPAVPTQQQPMPQAPQAPTIDMQRYQQLQDAAAPKTVNRADYKPRWYERLAAGLAGAAIGYSNPALGYKVGSGIATRRYDAAAADEDTREAGAQQNLKNFESGVDLQDKNFGRQSQGYENSLAGRRVTDEEANSAAEQSFRTTNAKREQDNSDREYQRNVGNDSFGHQMQRDQFGETQKRDQDESGYRRSELGIQGQRLKIEQDKATQDKTNAKGDVLKRGVDANKLDAARQTQLKALDGDDPKTGEPGYKSQRNSIMLNKKLSQEEKKSQVAQLDQEHADAKNQIEQAYSQSMNNLGYSTVPVTYGPDGKTVVNNSDGNAPGAPKQQAPAAQPKQGRAPTPAGMVRMRLPDGREMFFPKANQAAAQKRGAQLIGE